MVTSSFEIAPPQDDHDDWDENESDESDGEEAFDGTPPVSNGNGHANPARKKRMKKMKVRTERDYSANKAIMNTLFYNPQCRGMCCMGSIACLLVLLLVKLILPKGTSGVDSAVEEDLPECKVHTTDEPFSEWMHHIRRANGTDLCRPEVGL